MYLGGSATQFSLNFTKCTKFWNSSTSSITWNPRDAGLLENAMIFKGGGAEAPQELPEGQKNVSNGGMLNLMKIVESEGQVNWVDVRKKEITTGVVRILG